MMGTTLGLGVTSGLNLYATAFATGLALHLGWIRLAPGMEALAWLSHPTVMAVSGFLFLVEFMADKIPVVEHVWDLVHTLIRPLGATLIAWKAMGASVGGAEEVVLVLLAGGASLATHAGKSGLRMASSIAGGHAFGLGIVLSLAEDLVVFALAPLTIAHPVAALVVSLFVLLAVALVVPVGFRFLASRGTALSYALRHKMMKTSKEGMDHSDLPFRVARAMMETGISWDADVLVLPACVTGLKGIPRWSSGFATIGLTGVTFVTSGIFRTRIGTLLWQDGPTVLSSHIYGFKLQCDKPRNRVTLTFYPLTASMGRRLRCAVPAGKTEAERFLGLDQSTRADGQSS